MPCGGAGSGFAGGRRRALIRRRLIVSGSALGADSAGNPGSGAICGLGNPVSGGSRTFYNAVSGVGCGTSGD